MLWLCEKAGKALLKLDDDDFREHELHELLREHGPAERVAASRLPLDDGHDQLSSGRPAAASG